MPSPVMPAGVRAIIYVDTPRRVTQNIAYYEAELAPTHQTHIQAIANAIDVHFRALYVACLANACKYRGVMAYYRNPGTDIFWEAFSVSGDTAGAYASGTGNADVMPDEDVAVIRKMTGRNGREDRGRWFISGMPEAGNINGRLESAYGANVVALANKIPADVVIAVEEAPNQPEYNTVLHARHWNRKDNTLRPITNCLVTSTVMQQRRRRRPLLGLPVPGALSGG